MWLQVIILGAIIIDIVCKFIGVKECNDILERCKYIKQSVAELKSDTTQSWIDAIKTAEQMERIRCACEDNLKTTKAIMNGMGKDQYDIWETIHSINAAVDGLNKRLTNPRDLEPEWKPVDEETDYLPFTDPDQDI